jgi:hypothetical protein
MSLHGPFSTMPLPELLGWVGSSNRAGTVTVHGAGVETMLHVQRGRVDACAASDPPVLLGQFLLFHGAITEEDLDRAMREHAVGARRLGDVLIDIGAISVENLEEALTAKAEETVLGAFDHSDGWFVFDPAATIPMATMALDMPIVDAIARGGKRLEDAAVAAATLERPGQVLRKSAKTPSAKIHAAWPLRNAYGLVDGERTTEEIALHMHGTRFHVVQRLYQLYVEGFIELTWRRTSEDQPRLENGEGEVAAPTPHESTQESLSGAVSSETLEGLIPIAIPREIARQLGSLSSAEKYLLTQCGGTRNLRSITALAPMRAEAVIDTIRSLIDRGFLRASVGSSDRTARTN